MIVFELQKFGEIKQYTQQDLSYLQKKGDSINRHPHLQT